MTQVEHIDSPIIWGRDLDGTGSIHICSEEDAGAVKYVREQDVMGILPKVRNGQSDNMRRLRLAEQRDPVDNAFLAFVALSDAGREKMVARFNRLWEGRPNASRLDYTAMLKERNT